MIHHHARFAARLSAFADGFKNSYEFFTADFAKNAICRPVSIEGTTPLPFRLERRQSMKPNNHEEHIRYSFEAYCKKVIKRKALDVHREAKRRSEREITFSEMSAQELASLSVTDEYFTDEFVFFVFGESVGVSGAELGEALSILPADRREIVLLSYFLDMTDREIADKLNMARRTVAYQRRSTLQELKKLLESED